MAALLGCLLFIIVASVMGWCSGNSEITTIDDSVLDVNTHNIKGSVQLAVACTVYLVLKTLSLSKSTKIHSNIIVVLTIVCGLYTALAIIFLLNAEMFWVMKNWFFSVDVDMSRNEELARAGYLARYPFIFLDPNNSAYFMLMVSIFIIEDPGSPGWVRAGAWLTAVAAPILSASTGGLLAFSFYIGIKAFATVRAILACRREKSRPSLGLMSFIALGVAVIALAWSVIEGSQQLEVVSRLQVKADNTDPRVDKYINLLSSSWPPVIGRGHTMIVDGEFFKPHSDHLRLLYGYGLIVYLSCASFLCKHLRWSRAVSLLIPVVVASALNSVIDEPRFLYSFMVLLAITGTRPKVALTGVR
jgi:hypothetical protein